MHLPDQAGRRGTGPVPALRFALEKIRIAWDLLLSHIRYAPRVGLSSAMMLFLAEASLRRPISTIVRPVVPELLTITPPRYKRPLTMRTADTDPVVVRQVLALEEYRPVSSLAHVRLIVDCGANIGVTGYYFLHHYPQGTVIAIEPDKRNYEMCRRNLAPFGNRAIVLRGALWSERRPLRITSDSRRSGSWAFRVEAASIHDADVDGLTIPDILQRAGIDGPIDLLKVDIEGAEEEVFRQPPAWLDNVRHMAIELHSPAARTTFINALSAYQYTLENSGESTIVRDLTRRS
jgi:FkbM family methyltransferase